MRNHFQTNYNLTVSGCLSHDVGFNNKANIISSDQGKFFQKIYQRLSLEEIGLIVPAIKYLHKQGFLVPRPIKNTNDKYLVDFQGKPSVLFSYLPGAVKKKFTQEELSDVGKTIAKLHLSLKRYPRLDDFIKEGKDYNSTDWYNQNISKLKELDSLEAGLIIDEYSQLIRQWPKSLDLNKFPLSLLHWDFRNENILFQGNKITGITDFECMCYDNRIYDLIFAVIGFCMLEDDLNKDGIRTLIEGYHSIYPLEKSELTAFPYLLRLMTWDKWCSIYVSSEVGLSNRRKARIKHNHYKKCYLNMKKDPFSIGLEKIK